TVPAVMIGHADGAILRTSLPVEATLESSARLVRDSDLDAGVMAHEYMHGISNRLTGGPSNVGCLQNAEQAGEGWSDFLGLVLTAKPSDTPTTWRTGGSYLLFGSDVLGVGGGERPYPYTTDMSVDPLVYDDIVFADEAHQVGPIWTTMLWEMYWN